MNDTKIIEDINIRFNISPSALNCYFKCALTFYYNYIEKAEESDKTHECYGLGGNVVHNVLEEYALDKKTNLLESFNAKWLDKDLDNLTGFYGHKLKKAAYIDAVLNSKKALDDVYDVICPEEEYKIPTRYSHVNFKGIVDVQAKLKQTIEIKAENTKGETKKVILNKGDFVVMDYKTSSNMAEKGDNGFKIQGLFYSWIIWKVKNILPVATIFEYNKINKKKAYIFNEQDLKDFEIFVNETLDTIVSKGGDINNYEPGNWDDVFNGHKSLCAEEIRRRSNITTITLKLKNNRLFFNPLEINKIILDMLDKRWTYSCERHQYSDAFKKKIWDGKKHFLREKSFPAPFINDFYKVLKMYNEHYKADIQIKVEDLRDTKVTNISFNTIFKESKIEPRYYQVEATNIFASEKIYNVGIFHGACAIGKTISAGSIIRKVNNRTLFLVNRKELAVQTKKSFENQLGVKVGLLMEGELEVDKQITVGTIQTIDAILKRKDKTTKALEMYLYNVNTVIFDECHNVKDSGQYGRLSKKLKNVNLIVGLSGTPVKRGPDTLELNSLCGFVEYSYLKDIAIEEKYICQDKIYFIEHNGCTWGVDYNDSYVNNIVKGELRNTMIAELTNKLKKNKKILILTRRVEHANVLQKQIEGSYIINGTTDSKYRSEMYENFGSTRGTVLIGSVQIFSTGVDIPDLDGVIYAVASKDSNEVIQSIGRIHRKIEGKDVGFYFDFSDSGCEYLENATKERLRILDEYNYKVEKIRFTDLLDKFERKSL